MPYIYPNDPPISVTGSRKAEDHLNWLKDVVNAIELLQWFVRAIVGNTDGVLAYDPVGTDSLKVEATDPVSMIVAVNAGAGFLDMVPFRKSLPGQSALMVAPDSEPRIDTIGIDALTRGIVVYTGEEGAVPVAPSVATGVVKLAEVYHRVGETAIYDSDTSGEAYITDSRTLINA